MRKNNKTERGLKKVFCSIIIGIVVAMAFSSLVFAAAAPSEPFIANDGEDLRIAVLADTHYLPEEYVGDPNNPAFRRAISGDPKLYSESRAAVSRALEMIEHQFPRPDILLVPGDITKHGEWLGHYHMSQLLRDFQERSGIQVFVINGNHDLTTYAFRFDRGVKERTRHLLPSEFAAMYDGLGYGLPGTSYFIPPDGTVAGGLSYFVSLSDLADINPRFEGSRYKILAIDAGIYSRCANITNESRFEGQGHNTGGHISDALMEWALEKIEVYTDLGYTVIGMTHWAMMPHFHLQDRYLADFIMYNWEEKFELLADAGLRYVFTGHMHANSISKSTSFSGNTLMDIQTGSPVTYPGTFRITDISRGMAGGEQVERVANTVKQIYNVFYRGNLIYDWATYTREKLYGNEFLVRISGAILHDQIDNIVEGGGIMAFLDEMGLDFDIVEMVFGVVETALLFPMFVDLPSPLGAMAIRYNPVTQAIELRPSGVAGVALPDYDIGADAVLRLIDRLISEVERNFLEDPTFVLNAVADIVRTLDNTPVYRAGTPYERTLGELILMALLGHFRGNEYMPEWVEGVIANMREGQIIGGVLNTAIDQLRGVVTHILRTITVDAREVITSSRWGIALGQVLDDARNTSIYELLATFEFDVMDILDDFLDRFLTDSYITSLGQTLADVVESFFTDYATRDGEVGETVVLYNFIGRRNPQMPSIENGRIPDRITMTVGNSLQNRAISWATGTGAPAQQLQRRTFCENGLELSNWVNVAVQSERVTFFDPRFDLGFFATFRDRPGYSHKAQMVNLEWGRIHEFRVGRYTTCGLYWSEIFRFQTPFDPNSQGNTDNFDFIITADSQGMTRRDFQVYANTLSRAVEHVPNAMFHLHLGDFTEIGANNGQWTYLLNESRETFATLPIFPVSGNHEVTGRDFNALQRYFNIDGANGLTTGNHLPQANLGGAPRGVVTEDGVYYSQRIGDMLLIVLDTNDTDHRGAINTAQINWLTNTLSQNEASINPARFVVVAFHKSIISSGSHSMTGDTAVRREQLYPIFDLFNVSLVLGGHDHVYFRNNSFHNQTTTALRYRGLRYETVVNPTRVTYVTPSTSGVKFYQILNHDAPAAVSTQPNLPVFSRINIRGNTLFFAAYTVHPTTGQMLMIDNFAISYPSPDEGGVVVTPYQYVRNLIHALPHDLTTLATWNYTTNRYQTNLPAYQTVRNRINAARAAFDALTVAQRNNVDNLYKLQYLERKANQLEAAFSNNNTFILEGDRGSALTRTRYRVQVRNGVVNWSEAEWLNNAAMARNPRLWAFEDMINDARISTILFPITARNDVDGTTDNNPSGSIILRGIGDPLQDMGSGNNAGNGNINRTNLIFSGNSNVIIDNIWLNGERSTGSLLAGRRPIELQGNSMLTVTGASTKISSRNGTTEAFGVHLSGAGSKMVVNNSYELWGSEAAIRITGTNARAILFGGNVMGREGGTDRAAIDARAGSFTMYGGSLGIFDGALFSGNNNCRAILAQNNARIYIHGGEIRADNEAIPVLLRGVGTRMFVTGGTFHRNVTAAISVTQGGQLHMSPSHPGAVRIYDEGGFTEPFISAVDASVSPEITANISGLNATQLNAITAANAHFRRAGTNPGSFVRQVEQTSTQIAATRVGGVMSTDNLPLGPNFVWARVNLRGGVTNNTLATIPGIEVDGNAGNQVFMHGGVSLAHHVAIENLNIAGGDLIMRVGETRNIFSIATPDTAMRDFAYWSSSNSNVVDITHVNSFGTLATISANSVGRVQVFADLQHNPNNVPQASVWAYVVDPVIGGNALGGLQIDDDTVRRLEIGGIPISPRITVGWFSTNNNVISIGDVSDVGPRLLPQGLGEATVIARIYFDGAFSGISESVDITVVSDNNSLTHISVETECGEVLEQGASLGFDLTFNLPAVDFCVSTIYIDLVALHSTTYIQHIGGAYSRGAFRQSFDLTAGVINSFEFRVVSEYGGAVTYYTFRVMRNPNIAGARAEAILRLETFFAANFIESDYRELEWEELQRLLQLERDRINTLSYSAARMYHAAFDTNWAPFLAVPTDAGMSAEELAQARAAARAAAILRLEEYFHDNFYEGDYREPEWEELLELLQLERDRINLLSLEDATAYVAALDTDWQVFLEVSTHDDLVVEELAAAILRLEEYFHDNFYEGDYREPEWEKLQELLQAERDRIKSLPHEYVVAYVAADDTDWQDFMLVPTDAELTERELALEIINTFIQTVEAIDFFVADQMDANTQDEAHEAVVALLGDLVWKGTQVIVEAVDFTAAIAGTKEYVEGINGSFEFRVRIYHEGLTGVTADLILVILATEYVPGGCDNPDCDCAVCYGYCECGAAGCDNPNCDCIVCDGYCECGAAGCDVVGCDCIVCDGYCECGAAGCDVVGCDCIVCDGHCECGAAACDNPYCDCVVCDGDCDCVCDNPKCNCVVCECGADCRCGMILPPACNNPDCDCVGCDGDCQCDGTTYRYIFTTRFRQNFLNWFMFIILFGWIWMWFV